MCTPVSVASCHVYLTSADVSGSPSDARAQRVGPRQPVGADVLAGGQRRLPTPALIHAIEAVEDEPVHLLAGKQAVQVWIEIVRVVRDDEGKRARRRNGRGEPRPDQGQQAAPTQQDERLPYHLPMTHRDLAPDAITAQ